LSRSVWRIATDTPAYQADDFSGAGAKTTGGRWNEAGLSIVYTSETHAHLNAGGLPLNRDLVEVTIPHDIWDNARAVTRRSLPVGWDAEPAGQVSIEHGTTWARSGSSALLVVPSVIVQEEFDVLINPIHADSARITAIKQRKWLYDPRLAKPYAGLNT
jgi:RES domain-containing protein